MQQHFLPRAAPCCWDNPTRLPRIRFRSHHCPVRASVLTCRRAAFNHVCSLHPCDVSACGRALATVRVRPLRPCPCVLRFVASASKCRIVIVVTSGMAPHKPPVSLYMAYIDLSLVAAHPAPRGCGVAPRGVLAASSVFSSPASSGLSFSYRSSCRM